MKPEEIELIRSKHNASIVAPAGHGKTEMITELVDKLSGKKLVLTHTNAGVDALTQRLKKKNINKEKYCLSTISSFCMKWCEAYPSTGEIDLKIKITDKQFYNSQYIGTSIIFSHSWARNILFRTYSCVIVDEYQDCIKEQHQIFLEINKEIPVYVLGDPLQAIFGWAGELVSWSNLGFEGISIETSPHRWEKTNKELGEYLSSVRNILYPALKGKKVSLSTIPNGSYIKRISHLEVYNPKFINEFNKYQSTLYLTKWPQTQCSFSRRTGGLFQNDEAQNFDDLYNYAELLDIDEGYKRTATTIDFLKNCAIHVNKELCSYINHINKKDFNFTKIKKHKEFGIRIQKLYRTHDYDDILSILEWIKSNSLFRLYRRELYTELIRAIRYARDKGTTILDAAQQIRMIPSNQRKYAGFKKLSSRAVLSKGLEFDCVIIDLKDKYTVTELYVAMTRAKRVIYFITEKDSIQLDATKGIL